MRHFYCRSIRIWYNVFFIRASCEGHVTWHITFVVSLLRWSSVLGHFWSSFLPQGVSLSSFCPAPTKCKVMNCLGKDNLLFLRRKSSEWLGAWVLASKQLSSNPSSDTSQGRLPCLCFFICKTGIVSIMPETNKTFCVNCTLKRKKKIFFFSQGCCEA